MMLAAAIPGLAFGGVGPPSVGPVTAEYLEGHDLPLDVSIKPEGSETRFAFWVQTPTETYSFGAGGLSANAPFPEVEARLRHVRPKSTYRVWVQASNSSGSVEGPHEVVAAERPPREERERRREGTKFPLVLTSDGSKARYDTPTGAAVKLSVAGGDCEQVVTGKLKTNGLHDDHATFPPQEPQQGCEAGSTLEGQVGRVDLLGGSCFAGACERAPGGPLAIRFKPALKMTLPGPCVYEATVIDGRHGEADAGFGEAGLGEAEGLLAEPSAAGCARSALIDAELEVSDLETHAAYESEEPF
jgi:hypothetical protein